MFSDLRLRLRALFARSDMERELDAELRFHLEHETEKLVKTGLSRADAERQARIALGGVERIKEDARDARGIALLDTLSQDLRYAWRGIRATPSFAAAVVVTLALGVGANTAMFGIIDRLLFRAPSYLVDADRVHRVYLDYLWDGELRTDRVFEYTRYAELAASARSFDRTAALAYRELAVGTGDDAREITVAAASASFFDFFDARPALGRFYTAAEDHTPQGAPVAVLGFGFWQSRYAGRSDVLGTSLHIDNVIYTVIGVAPEGLVGVTDDRSPVAFVPITTFAGARNATYYQTYNWGWLEMFVRRKPDVDVASANADLSAAFERSWERERTMGRLPPAATARPRVELGPVQQSRGPTAAQDSKVLTWVMGVAVIVLLIACANVANLLLTRAISRKREIALRLALGVSRGRLLQQLITESVVLSFFGGAAGLAVAQWGGQALRRLFLRAEDAGAVVNDSRTVAFVAAITVGVALLTGVAPVLHALRSDVAGALKAGAREGTYRRSRLRSGLLLFQGALSVLLLVGAGLFVRSLANVRGMRLGYDFEPIVLLEGRMRGPIPPAAEFKALMDRLLAAAVSMPGVRNASFAVSVPFWSNEARSLYVPGVDSIRKLGRFIVQTGSSSYFETIGTRIVRGRAFTDADREGTQRVAIVGEGMAKLLWPGRDAIGQVMRINSDTSPLITIVGIAENVRGRMLADPREHWYYLPIAQFGNTFPSILARVNGRAEDHVETLRRRLQREMPGASYVTARPLGALVGPQRRSWEFGATMFVAFGGLALVLAAIGLYSVIAYAVAQRTHELGVRIALGAGTGSIMQMIVGEGIAFAAIGIVVGGSLSLAAGKWLAPLLFNTSPRDPAVFGTVAGVLLVVAVLATVRPALRATRVDPTEALRSD